MHSALPYASGHLDLGFPRAISKFLLAFQASMNDLAEGVSEPHYRLPQTRDVRNVLQTDGRHHTSRSLTHHHHHHQQRTIVLHLQTQRRQWH